MPEQQLQTPQSSQPSDQPSSQAEHSAPAWADSELDSLHQHEHKHEKVREMFNAIARAYDLNNRVHSLWRDEAWRKKAVLEASVQPGETVLDCACGTGDLTQAFAKHSKAAHVTGADYTPGMLDIARHKHEKLHPGLASRIEYTLADAQKLPFADAAFDVVSIAFGIRNVQRPELALNEFGRVLRPGGRLVILEFGQPAFAPARWFNRFYCGVIMPRTATLIARDRSGAYKYLPRSVSAFKTRPEMEAMLGSAGFTKVKSKALTMGICNLYRAQKP